MTSTAAPHSTSQHSTSQHSTSQHNTSQHSPSQHRTSQHSTSQHNTSQHSTSQQLTAPHSTTPHSTAPHSTSQQHTYNTTEESTTLQFAAPHTQLASSVHRGVLTLTLTRCRGAAAMLATPSDCRRCRAIMGSSSGSSWSGCRARCRTAWNTRCSSGLNMSLGRKASDLPPSSFLQRGSHTLLHATPHHTLTHCCLLATLALYSSVWPLMKTLEVKTCHCNLPLAM